MYCQWKWEMRFGSIWSSIHVTSVHLLFRLYFCHCLSVTLLFPWTFFERLERYMYLKKPSVFYIKSSYSFKENLVILRFKVNGHCLYLLYSVRVIFFFPVDILSKPLSVSSEIWISVSQWHWFNTLVFNDTYYRLFVWS